MRGLEVTGKGRTERLSWTTEERRALDAAQGKDCCGGIVDCDSDDAFVGPLAGGEGGTLGEGWIGVRKAWERVEGLGRSAVEVAHEVLDCGETEDRKGVAVSLNVRCEKGWGLIVRESAVETLLREGPRDGYQTAQWGL